MSGLRRFVARQRRRWAQVTWRLALGPVSGASPRAYVGSIVRQSWQAKIQSHLEDATVMSGARVERYDVGRALPVSFRPTRAYDQRHLYRLRDVCVSPVTGLAWLPNGPILMESFGPIARLLGNERWTLEEPLLGRGKRVDGPVVVLPRTSYSHWLLETLPCVLHAFAAEPEAALVVPTEMPRFANEAIELLGFRDVRRIDEPITAERLVLPTRLYRGIAREDLEIVRAALLSRVAASAEGGERIYVSRRLASRTVANEWELAGLLERRGFEPIAVETLPFAEQVSLFARAGLVAGQHGAGLANLVFAPKPARLMEIFTAGLIKDNYACLAATLGGAYEPFYCTEGSAGQNVAPLDTIEAALRAG